MKTHLLAGIMPVGPALLCLILILSFCRPTSALASGSSASGRAGAEEAKLKQLNLDGTYLRGIISDARSVVASPLAWGNADWLKFGLIAGATVAVSNDEDHAQQWMQARRDDNTRFAADLAEPLGNGKYAVPALGALYLCGRVCGSDRMRRTALLSFESVAISCGITTAIKYLSHKHRPTETPGEDTAWGGPSLSTAYVSFPSGHATCAFAIGTVVAAEYRNSRFVPPLAYGAAALCAMSRMHDNVHWLSDIIVGSTIGYFTARAVTARHGDGADSGFSLVPSIQATGPGLSLEYRF